MPLGADTVFMQEDVRVDGSAVIVPPGLKLGANRRLAGEDVRKGSVVLPAGRRLAAQDVALAAAVGLTTLVVRRRVRVALFSTGDEIVRTRSATTQGRDLRRQPHAPPRHAGTTRRGGDRSRHPQDDPAALEWAMTAAAREHDLVLTSGGVSTGEPTTCVLP